MTDEDATLVTILLVEDDSVDVRVIKRGLEKKGILNPIRVASDGVEALEVLRGKGGHDPLQRPFLILLDLNMPRMDGLEFLDEIRADPKLKDSVVFVLTTSKQDTDKVAAYERNIAGYLVKSQAGDDFMKYAEMLDRFLLSIHFPPPKE